MAKSIGILRVRDVIKKTGLSRSSIDRFEKRKDFPKRIHLSVGVVGWYRNEIDEWLLARHSIKGTSELPVSKIKHGEPYGCFACRYWSVIQGQRRADIVASGDVFGVCKRFPPSNVGQDWNQPATEGENWCGEFKLNE